jgi:hypothetical protein
MRSLVVQITPLCTKTRAELPQKDSAMHKFGSHTTYPDVFRMLWRVSVERLCKIIFGTQLKGKIMNKPR